MLIHHTVALGFIPEGDPATRAGLQEARNRLGADEMKRGYSPERCQAVRECIAAARGTLLKNVAGHLVGVQSATTNDASGNTYRKARVHLRQENGQVLILSLEMGAEFTQRLLAKLEAVPKGAFIRIGCDAKVVERNGRSFVNHYASVKDSAGKEIEAVQDHFGQCAEKARQREADLKALGLTDPSVVKSARASVKAQHFEALLAKLAAA